MSMVRSTAKSSRVWKPGYWPTMILRQQFSRWCLLHRQIHELLSENTLHQLMEQYVTGSAAMPKKALSKSTATAVDPHVKAAERGAPNSSHPRRATRRRTSHSPSDAVVVARLDDSRHGGGGKFGFRGLDIRSSQPNQHIRWVILRFGEYGPGRPTRSGGISDVVATLTQMSEGVWQPGVPQLTPGQLLRKDTRASASNREWQRSRSIAGRKLYCKAPAIFS